MKTRILTAASMAALLLSGAAAAQPAAKDGNLTRADYTARIDARFAKLDTNRDGQVTSAERQNVRQANRAERVQRRFERLDADQNGSVTLAEMQAAQDQRSEAGERRGKRGHFGGRGGKGPRGERAHMTVSKADFQARALQWFDRADADKNGIVTTAERQQAFAARKAPRQ